jgi:hypothetical protein
MLDLSTLSQAIAKVVGVTIGSLNVDKRGIMNQH